MSQFKCKMCGGTLEIQSGSTVAECEYCGAKQTLPKLDDEKRANLYDRANHFRRSNEFDKASDIYEQILNEDNTDAEAYWSLVLCRFGIEYVEDPFSHRRVPTVHRAQFTSIFDDDNYKSALKNADTYQRVIYEEEAKAINEIQKGILAISAKEEPFDVFICYKETDDSGKRTHDSVLAQDLYYQLKQEGFKVFFSRITLEDKLGSAYEPYIFAALNSAKVMVVLGTKPEYFNAVWVKNEWSRFLSLIKKGEKKMLIPAYKDMDPYNLPKEFSHLQAQDMSKLGFMQDLIRGIKKILGRDKKSEASTVERVVVQGDSNARSVAPLLKRAFLFLEDGEFDNADEYAEKVLDIDPECGEAYLVKLLVDLKLRSREKLADYERIINNMPNFQKAVKYGSPELVKELSGYSDNIQLKFYNRAIEALEAATTPVAARNAAKLFDPILTFRDSKAKRAECLEKANEIIYNRAIEALEAATTPEAARNATKLFDLILDFRDSKAKRAECLEKANEIIYNHAIEALKAATTPEAARRAADLFDPILDFRDSKAKRAECLEKANEIIYNHAIEALKVATTPEAAQKAADLFDPILDFRDSKAKRAECLEKANEMIYNRAIEALGTATTPQATEEAAKLFDPILNFRDAKVKQLEGYYTAAVHEMNKANAQDIRMGAQLAMYQNAVRIFSLCIDYEDSRSLSKKCAAQWDIIRTKLSQKKKRKIVLTLVAVSLLIAALIAGGAYLYNTLPLDKVVDGGIIYAKLSNGTEYQVAGVSDSNAIGNVIIPETVRGLPVTSIGELAFYNCSSLTSVTIPNSVTSIGSGAFSGCTSLESITLPFVGDKVHSATDTYQYPFGYIFGTSSYTGGIATKQDYYGSSTSYTVSLTYYIPSRLKSVTITGGTINYGAFYNCANLRSITIPDSVTSIGKEAFRGCSSLRSITIPDSVTWIGRDAFSGCSNLTSITIPDSVTSIGDTAFSGCASLTSITIPSSVTSISKEAFRDCSNLTSITIPNSVTSIGSSAFHGCSKLTSITIPDGVTSIGSSAFHGCSKLTSITIPDSVTSIGNLAFYNCSSLTSITIPDGVKSISDYAFSGCSSLTSITIPNSVTSIGSSAFYNCTGLTSITIPNSVTSIGNGAFKDCSSLESMTLPFVGGSETDNTNTFLGYIFGASSYSDNSSYVPNSLKSVTVTGTIIGNYAFYDCTSLTSVTIGNSVTSIGGSAFYYCSKLTNITIPNGVTSIGNYAFKGCSNLTSITIPDSVTSIGYAAFSDCSSLASITIPDSVTSIGYAAFSDCSSLTSITIPDSVTSIGSSAFSYCTSLTSVTIGNSVTSIGESAFSGCSSLTGVTIGNGVTSIGSSVFYGCSKLTSITIPSSVTSIGNSAFHGCSKLTSITISDSVTSIGSSAFYNCTGLTSITIGNSVTSIGSSAFFGCSSLASVTIGNGVTSIGDYAFRNCSSLTSITIPDSVTSIGSAAFSGCSSLESITLPFVGGSATSNTFLGYIFGASSYSNNSSYVPISLKSVTITSATSIGNYAFRGCTNLTSITIPDSVTSIGWCAFSDCTHLTSITFMGTKAQWNAISKSSNWNNNTGSYTVYCTDGTISK